MKIKFTKMQGLGNDFAVIDATQRPFELTPSQIQQLANRRLGIGFDQLLVIESTKLPQADFHFRIFNADGNEVGQCGNGARCVARFIQEKKLNNKKEIRISTLNDILTLHLLDNGKVGVVMGIPRFEPAEIPFIADALQNTYSLSTQNKTIQFSVVNVGNPHAVIQVDHLMSTEVESVGRDLSQHKIFPEGVNVGFMHVIDSQHIRLRVYERGTGQTLACGSGACAAMVLGRRNGLLQERVTVNQPGGSLTIDWQGPGTSIYMVGPAQFVYEAQIPPP